MTPLNDVLKVLSPDFCIEILRDETEHNIFYAYLRIESDNFKWSDPNNIPTISAIGATPNEALQELVQTLRDSSFKYESNVKAVSYVVPTDLDIGSYGTLLVNSSPIGYPIVLRHVDR